MSAPDDGLATRLSLLEARLAAITERTTAWYKDPGTLISLIAVALSLVTFAYTALKEANEKKDQQREELHSDIVQLNSLATQSSELYIKYKSDPDYYTSVSPSVRAQMALIGTSAYTLLISLGDDASALDSAVVANALSATGDYATATNALLKALPLAKNPGEYEVIARMLGNYYFYRNDVDEGNKYYRMADNVFLVFSNSEMSPMEMSFVKAENHAYWAAAAASQKHCDLSQQHVSEATKYLTVVHDNGDPSSSELLQIMQKISANCPNVSTKQSDAEGDAHSPK